MPSLMSTYFPETLSCTCVYMYVHLARGCSSVVESLTIMIKPSNTLTGEREEGEEKGREDGGKVQSQVL